MKTWRDAFVLVGLLLILMSCFACGLAGLEDGFTLEAFDTGSSSLWWLALVSSAAGVMVVLYAFSKSPWFERWW